MVGDEGYIERQTEISAFVYCTITSLACRKGLRERMIQLYVNVVEGEMPFPCLACFFVMVVAEGVQQGCTALKVWLGGLASTASSLEWF